MPLVRYSTKIMRFKQDECKGRRSAALFCDFRRTSRRTWPDESEMKGSTLPFVGPVGAGALLLVPCADISQNVRQLLHDDPLDNEPVSSSSTSTKIKRPVSLFACPYSSRSAR